MIVRTYMLGCLFSLFSFTSSFSQLQFSGGLEAGASTSQVSGDALSGYDKFGLSAGPYIRASFSEKISARMSILYINKGSKKNANPDNNDFRTYVIALNYVEIPVLFNYTYQNLRGEAGVSFGTLLSSQEIDNGFSRDFQQPFDNNEYSFILGVNYLFAEKLFVNARFSQSIIPIRKAPSVVNPLSFYEAGQYNSVIQLMLGYEF